MDAGKQSRRTLTTKEFLLTVVHSQGKVRRAVERFPF